MDFELISELTEVETFATGRGIREARRLTRERGELAVLEIERSELAHLIPQQIEAGLAIRRARLELEHPVQQLQPDAVGDRDLLGERFGAGIRVEQLTLSSSVDARKGAR